MDQLTTAQSDTRLSYSASQLDGRWDRKDIVLPWGPSVWLDPNGYRYWLRAHQRPAPMASSVSDELVISVVMPVYRPELWYFRQCVDSIRSQSYANWELCMCDDGSSDDALSACLEEMRRTDRRINVAALESNSGISAATNQALSMARGEFVALVDNDDVLDPSALEHVAAAIAAHPNADVLYSDEDKMDDLGRRFQPAFKPDWSPELLLQQPYLGHLFVIRRSLLEKIGGFRSEFDGSQDFDVMQRVTELAREVVHIPEVLYHWRTVAGSAAGDPTAKAWAHLASKRVVEDTIARRGIDADVTKSPFLGNYWVRRAVARSPKVSIVIPFRDGAGMTARCLSSLERAPGYDNFEIVLVDNGSIEPETEALVKRVTHQDHVRILDWPTAFNWAAINNYASSQCDGELLLFINNDIEAMSEGWLKALVELAQLADVGTVGAKLYYPDGTMQHSGVVLGMGTIAGHLFGGMPPAGIGYCLWDQLVRPVSAVTGACLMTRRQVFEEMGGFDEKLRLAYNDVDYCMRVIDGGYTVLHTPHAELVHHESVSRGMSGYLSDVKRFLSKWDRSRLEDPYYNPNLSRFDTWCPLRKDGEDERWNALLNAL